MFSVALSFHRKVFSETMHIDASKLSQLFPWTLGEVVDVEVLNLVYYAIVTAGLRTAACNWISFTVSCADEHTHSIGLSVPTTLNFMHLPVCFMTQNWKVFPDQKNVVFLFYQSCLIMRWAIPVLRMAGINKPTWWTSVMVTGWSAVIWADSANQCLVVRGFRMENLKKVVFCSRLKCQHAKKKKNAYRKIKFSCLDFTIPWA